MNADWTVLICVHLRASAIPRLLQFFKTNPRHSGQSARARSRHIDFAKTNPQKCRRVPECAGLFSATAKSENEPTALWAIWLRPRLHFDPMNPELAIIGAGNMAEAIARGVMAKTVLRADQMTAADV